MPLPISLSRVAAVAPGVPEEKRLAAARAVVDELRGAGRVQEADAFAVGAAARLRDPLLRAELLGQAAWWSLDRGVATALVGPAYAARLEAADVAQAAGDLRAAASSFTEALRLATHRVLHFDNIDSPLADDPSGFTAPLRSSAVAEAVRAPRGRAETRSRDGDRSTADDRSAAGAGSVAGGSRPVRLVIGVRVNAEFLGEIRDYFESHPRFDVRFVDFGEAHELDRFAKSPDRIAFQTLAGKGKLRSVAEEVFAQHLEWADVVFVEWCAALAALVTQVDPGSTRIVVRMHSYEVFSPWPHLIDFSRVDDMVFVSRHLRDLAVAAVPGLRGPEAPALHVLTNAVNLERCVRPKDGDARFTLGVVGASKMVKDPRWAIAVLRELRRHDDRYRLVLVRGELEEPTEAAREYVEAFDRDLQELAPLGAVEVRGHTDDIPGTLQDIGVAVSSSARESFHIGFVEAVASGAVPVVRDWPFFRGATRTLFPPEWTVDSPEAAAERILRLTASEAVWRRAGDEAAEHALRSWDWSVVRRSYEELLAGNA